MSKRARKDIEWHEKDGAHIDKVVEILETLERDPYERSQGYKALKGKLKGLHERRINKQYRVIYEIDERQRPHLTPLHSFVSSLAWHSLPQATT